MVTANKVRRTEEAIEHTDLTEKTYEHLFNCILSGQWAIGQRLQVTTLSEQLGVSHTPVKIALNRLAAEGIVQHVPRHGMFIARPCRKDVEEIHEVRLLIELHALAVGVPKSHADCLADLRAELDRFAELIERTPVVGWDTQRASALNHSFHEKIVALSGNDKLVEIWRGLHIHEQIARINALSQSAPPAKTLAEHSAILAALEARDVETAQREMRAHIVSSAAALANAVDELNRSAGSDR